MIATNAEGKIKLFSGHHAYDLSVWALTFCVLAFGMVWRGSAAAGAVALSFLGLGMATLKTNYFRICWQHYRAWMIGLSALGLAILLRLLVDLDPRIRYADSAMRLMVALPIFVAFCHTRRIGFQQVRWALPVAVVLMLTIGWMETARLNDPRIRTEFTNTIPFAAFCLVFAVTFFIYSFGRSRGETFLSILTLTLAGVVIYLSQSRGVWIASIAAMMYLAVSSGGFKPARLLPILMAIPVLLIAIYQSSPTVQSRVQSAVIEYADYFSGKKDGSVSMRMDLAAASYQIFKEHPWIGVGRDIVPVMRTLHQQGAVGKAVSDAVDTHGELFFNAASLGSVGLLVYLLFYVGVTLPYVRATQSAHHQVRKLGHMGVACNLIFLVVGFSHITLGLVMYASIYATLQAVMLATLYKLTHAAEPPHDRSAVT